MRQILSFSPNPLLESASALHNPYRGFYRIFRYTLTDNRQHMDASAVGAYELSLVLLEINLRNYRTGAISTAALAQLDAILNTWSQSDAQIILRFLYDWDGIAKATEPEALPTILTHMDQAGDVVNRYAAAVYLMQGVFIGNWGEMHGSHFADARSVKALAAHLHAVIAPSIYLSVRTPAQWRMITGVHAIPAKGPAGASQSSVAGRLGLYNDGMLGSWSDLGTYGDATASGKRTREAELSFQNRLCQYVPNGGEAVYDTPYSDLPAAISYFKTIHAAYLNADYDPTVLKKWSRTVWKGKDAFSGCDGLFYIEAHLGYRYTVRRFTVRKTGLRRPRIVLRLTLENVGFGNALKPFEAAVLFQNTATEESIRIPVPFDFCELKSGQRMQRTVSLRETDLPCGTYQICLSVTDPATGKQIALANTGYAQERGLLLGQLVY